MASTQTKAEEAKARMESAQRAESDLNETTKVGGPLPATYEDVTATHDFSAYIPTDWEDALKELQGEIIEFEGSPWQVLSNADKRKLVDKEFIVWDIRFSPGDYGGYFCSILVVTKDLIDGKNHFCINDGSTGLAQQMDQWLVRFPTQKRGLRCRNGLRVSDYWYNETTHETYNVKPDVVPDGEKVIPASTYYIA